jgi:hypothetical protein
MSLLRDTNKIGKIFRKEWKWTAFHNWHFVIDKEDEET